MDNKKFETLIDLIINENEEQARALFHDIVVEKSREIYESMMYDDSVEEGMGGQVGRMLDEINAEESGVVEGDDEEEFDIAADDDGEADITDIEADGELEDGGEEDLEGRVIEIEDKLDQLMAEFEEIMGGDEEDFGDEEDMGGEEDFGDEEGEEAMMEAVQLKKIGGETYNKFGQMGDNGAQTKSPGLQGSGQAGMASKPVRIGGAAESVPSSAKAPTNAYTKGETQVKNAGSFKNSPNGTFSEKGEAAPKPVKSQATGVNTSSPVAESRKTAKKRI